MAEYQTHEAVTRQLYEEVSRLKAINAELVASIQKPVQADTSQIMSNGIKPNNSLAQAARQALEVLSELAEWESEGDPRHPASAAITALREALDAAHQPAAVGQEPVTWIANEWSVFNTGAEVASGLSLNEAMDYLTDERAAREWSVVCVINKDNMPTRAAPQPARQPLTDDWIRGMCKESWVFDAAKQWIRIAERAHGIGGEA